MAVAARPALGSAGHAAEDPSSPPRRQHSRPGRKSRQVYPLSRRSAQFPSTSGRQHVSMSGPCHEDVFLLPRKTPSMRYLVVTVSEGN